MHLLLEPLLSAEAVAELRAALLGPAARWGPGAATAGWQARQLKQNQQLQGSSAQAQRLSAQIASAVMADALVQAAAFPRHVHGVLFSRSGVGDGYGRHVDNAFMANGRSDLSFTVALSDPASYEGGELVLEQSSGEERFKLPIGHALVYPSTRLHRVETVHSGDRLVAVGWIQSRIRHGDYRELLFELDTARRALFARSGHDSVADLLSRSYSHLLRRWGR